MNQMQRILRLALLAAVAFLCLAQKTPIPTWVVQYFDTSTGQAIPCVGCKLSTCVAGLTCGVSPSNPQATYTDPTGATPNSDPVILDSSGQANVWLTPGLSYKLELYNPGNVLLSSQDNVPGGTTAGSSSVTANYVYAGPTSGGAMAPAFRPLVAADVPSLTGSYASTTLNNLGTTNLNAGLLFQTGLDVGSTAKPPRYLYFWGAGTFGSTSIRIGGTPTGARQWNVPDVSDTFAGLAAAQTFTNKTFTNPIINSFVNAGPIFAQTASVTVANTTSNLTLVGAGQGSVTLPANFLTAGKSIKLHMLGVMSSTSAPTITLSVKVGSSILATTAAGASGNGTNNVFEIELVITCRTTGATGTIFAQGFYTEHYASGLIQDMPRTTAFTIDTTATNTLDVLAQWGTMAAGNTITATNFTIEDVL